MHKEGEACGLVDLNSAMNGGDLQGWRVSFRVKLQVTGGWEQRIES